MGLQRAWRAGTGEGFVLPSVPADERVYAIGDIHGRLDLLTDLMVRICRDGEARADGRQARVVFLGDYIDRGEQSKGVLEVLTRMARMGSPNIIFLRGNHEDALGAFLATPIEGSGWLDFGGLQTLASFGIRPPRLRFGRRDFLRVRSELELAISPYGPLFDAMITWFRTGDVVFTHAGVKPGVPLDLQPQKALLWGDANAEVEAPLPGLRVVHGHFDRKIPVSGHGRVCVDTGAYYSHRLTAVRLDESEGFLSTDRAF